MAGSVTEEQAVAFWEKYNTDGNDTLTVEEVKACLAEVYETVDDFDVNEKFIFFGQKEAKPLTKCEFIKGMRRTDQCEVLNQAFKEMDKDKSGSLCLTELKDGLEKHGFTGERAEILLDELDYDNDKSYNIKEFLEAVAFSDSFVNTYKF